MYKIENITNKTFQDDNIKILKCIPDNTIDLVYLDPPFFSQTNWEKNGNKFEDKWKDMNEYIEFMSIRLKELHRILKMTGSIYLHCDSSASHYLKIEMDKIFGYNNFKNEVIWHYTKMSNVTNNWISNTDSILFYTKTEKYTFNLQYSDEGSALYERFANYVDDDNKLRYGKIKHIKQQLLDSYINSAKKRKRGKLDDNDVVIDYKNKGKRKYDNVWDIAILKGNSDENLEYPTQKREDILEKIILASSNRNDIILDPFCGSGTSCAAAKKNLRKYIGIDKNHNAIKITNERLDEIHRAKPLFDF